MARLVGSSTVRRRLSLRPQDAASLLYPRLEEVHLGGRNQRLEKTGGYEEWLRWHP